MAVSIPNVARVLTLAVLASAVAVGCSKKVKETPPAPQVEAPATVTQETPKSNVYTPADLDSDACLIQRTVYFDLDKDLVKPEFAAVMNCHAKYLRDRPSARLRLEGNADERGSREYNLGLGERRGNAVSSVLQANGGSPAQLTVISYGEERPVCNDSNEACWSKNRRVELIYTEK